jgi:hypothetical protein
VFVLVLIPAALLWLAWQMAGLHTQQARPDPSHPETESAANDNGPSHNERAAILQARRALARWCVESSLRVADPGLRSARLLLVVATAYDCGADCEAERIAERLNDRYHLEGLRVLLIRTVRNGRMDSPMGVSTVMLDDCAPLLDPLGHDHFLRFADGSLSSSGDRHEAALLHEVELDFDPEPAVRRQFNLRN